MSTENEVQLPGVDQAAGVLDSVYTDAFFSKMAEFGFNPQTEADAVAMLETGVQMDYIPEEPAVKQASASPFAQVNERLKTALTSEGYVTPPSFEENVKTAAFMYAQDPAIYSSVLSVKAAEAQVLLDEQEAAAGQTE